VIRHIRLDEIVYVGHTSSINSEGKVNTVNT